MKSYELIRTAHRVYGKSIKQITREYGHHHSTIKKALSEKAPKYSQRESQPRPVIEAYLDVIDNWLLSDQKVHHKQRHTARRIYDRLVKENYFQGSERTVRHWVSVRKKELGIDQVETMIPLCPEVGKEAEVDWGEAFVIMEGKKRKVYLFCMRCRYSGKSFVRAYPFERQEMFFDAHIHAFDYFGGIFPVLVYDNLTTAVKKIMKGRKRIEQDGFAFFRSYYTFEARFCNPAKGNEKGGVEGFVGYSRRNFLVPYPEVKDFDELNQHLIKQCQSHCQKMLPRDGGERCIAELYEEEKASLISIPPVPYGWMRDIKTKVNTYQVVRVDNNYYSVPKTYGGCELTVLIGCWEIEIYSNHKKIESHPRSFGHNDWVLNPFHYLNTLKRKPGAFDSARPLKQWREQWPSAYELTLKSLRERKGFSAGTREFIEILQLHENYPEDQVQSAVELAAESSAWGLESIKLLLPPTWGPYLTPPSLPKDRIPGVTDVSLEEPNLANYDNLLN
ncbi:IS21 family transposase [Deltaproteobacteria bacterium TL4]